MKKSIIFFLVLVISSSFSASLGIAPAKVEVDFVPGAEHEISYTIISDQAERKMEVYAEGDLFPYIKLSKDESVGPGSFTAKIKFPDEIKEPGEHIIVVGVREVALEDAFIGTSINVRGIIKVFVPYPGRYTDVELNIPDGNVNELVPVEVHVINRGKELLDINAKINFLDSSNDLVHTMSFTQVQLNLTQDRYFRRFLNTTGYRPGDYLAQVIVDYGEIREVNRTFRIGSLFVNITNFTTELPKKGIQKFLVDVESRWNGNLDEVYVDVDLVKGEEKINFRTPSVPLGAWSRGTLSGFVDTTNLEGEYNTNVTLYYAKQKSFASGTLTITEFNVIAMVAIIAVAIAVIVIIIIIFILRRRKLRGR